MNDLKKLLADPWWRLNNLYLILDKDGKQVRFKPNPPQEKLFREMHTRNVILKARQLGFSTFIDLFILDTCLFNKGVEAVIIADTLPNAEEIFRRKIMYPYEHLPPDLRELLPPKEGTKGASGQLQLSNESIINVAVSARSSTAQIIHSTELAKVAAEHPDKADEFVTGTLGAASSKKALVFIESTARGAQGVFYDYCKLGMNNALEVEAGTKTLHELDWKFHFFPWTEEPQYALDAKVPVPDSLREYFTLLRDKHSITLTPEQENWYAVMYAERGDRMRSEYPSYPMEAFEQIIKGAYFAQQFAELRKDGRLCGVPHERGCAVDTYWDLGMNDSTAIWFLQDVGREIHVIDYFESEGEGLEFYKDMLDRKQRELGYRYGKHVGPHDLSVRELGTGTTRLETARKLGLHFFVCPKPGSKADAIETARNFFSRCWFDREKCADGLVHLELYCKEWDKKRLVYKDRPKHDEHSHGADAWLTAAVGHTASVGTRRVMTTQVTPHSYEW